MGSVKYFIQILLLYFLYLIQRARFERLLQEFDVLVTEFRRAAFTSRLKASSSDIFFFFHLLLYQVAIENQVLIRYIITIDGWMLLIGAFPCIVHCNINSESS